jgi:hypothetical protein
MWPTPPPPAPHLHAHAHRSMGLVRGHTLEFGESYRRMTQGHEAGHWSVRRDCAFYAKVGCAGGVHWGQQGVAGRPVDAAAFTERLAAAPQIVAKGTRSAGRQPGRRGCPPGGALGPQCLLPALQCHPAPH